MMLFYVEMADRDRQVFSFRLDDLVAKSIREQALEEGISVNKWLENHLFDYFKNVGKIAKNETRLPENRGGDRKSKKYKEND